MLVCKKNLNRRLGWERICGGINLLSEAVAIWIDWCHVGCLFPMAMLCRPVPFTSPWSKCNRLGNQLDIMGKSVQWPRLLMDKYPETWACKCAVLQYTRFIWSPVRRHLRAYGNELGASDTQSYKVLTIWFYLHIINGFNNTEQDWIRDVTPPPPPPVFVTTGGSVAQRSRAALVFMIFCSA